MYNGRIHSVESMGLVDGPGIRTVLFFQGCHLRCQYCHNPDTWALDGGKEMDVPSVMKQLRRYRPYYGEEGGVTCSGGEPLLQIEFLTKLFQACKAEGISTCLDTAGYGLGYYDELLKVTDLVIFDVKHPSPTGYQKLTGGNSTVPIQFLDAVEKSDTRLWMRHVVVPHLTDEEAHLNALGEYIKKYSKVEKVELLPYHTLGVDKYKTMGLAYALQDTAPMSKEETKKLQHTINGIMAFE